MKKTLAHHRHCGRGPAIHAVHKEKTLLNRLDPGSVSGMTFLTRAFTLIELLVVVLIIGILSAIALPQYTKAVRKARVAEARMILKNLVDATDLYYLSNNDLICPDSSDGETSDLDITIPTTTQYWEFEAVDSSDTGCLYSAHPLFEDQNYVIAYSSQNYVPGANNNGKFVCEGMNDAGGTICKGLGGSLISGKMYSLP